jgi:hypothetical protein
MSQYAVQGLRAAFVVLVFGVIPACSGSNNSSTTPPVFAGVTSANPGPAKGQITLTWAPATDFAGGGITYLVYISNAGTGTELSTTPQQFSGTTNSTGVTLSVDNNGTNLQSGNTYWIIVHAQDVNGNVETNPDVEVTPTAL